MAFILIIDDEEDTREMVQEILEMANHTVKGASDWVKGNSIIIREKPDMVLLDFKMPGIKGDKVMAVLKDTIKDLPKMVFYSGMDKIELQKLVLQYKADGYIQKGGDMDSLIFDVQRFLNK